MKKVLVLGLLVAVAGLSAPLWSQGAAPATQPAGEAKKYAFDSNESLAGWKITGDVSVDMAKNREGKGGSMKIGPKGKAVLKVGDTDASGKLELYVFDDGKVPADSNAGRSGPCWGLLQSDGKALAIGAIYAKYLKGSTTYAVGDSADGKNFYRVVQYVNTPRTPAGWHKWTFDWDPEKGLKILHNDKDLNPDPAKPRFKWEQIGIKGFSSIAIWGDSGKGDEQTVWVADVSVTPGGPVTNPPKGPAPKSQPAK
jgi:hypothetical protein